MLSATCQGWCLCENPPGLRVDTNNLEIAALVGAMRRAESKTSGRPDNHGFSGADAWDIDIEGAAAEMAYCKFRDRYWTASVGSFKEADNANARNLAIIDQSLAAKAFPNESAVGKRICVHIPKPTCLEVIGVVEHQRLRSLASPGREQIFLTDGFWGIGISRHWALRTSGDPAKYAAAVRAEVAKFAPGRLAVTEMQTMETTLEQAQATTRFELLLIGLFATVAASPKTTHGDSAPLDLRSIALTAFIL